MKKKSVSITFRANSALNKKLELAIKAMDGPDRTAVLEKALELGLDLLDHTEYEPTKFFLRMNKALAADVSDANNTRSCGDTALKPLADARPNRRTGQNSA